jgi:acetylornithine deacetylase
MNATQNIPMIIGYILLLLLFTCSTSATVMDKETLKLHISHYFQQFETSKEERKRVIQPLQQWIQEKSLPENENGIQQLVYQMLKDELRMDLIDMWTLDRQKQELIEHKDFVNPRSWESLSKSPNLVGFWFPDDMHSTEQVVSIDAGTAQQTVQISQEKLLPEKLHGKIIILNGHVDVVPVGSASDWINGDAFSGHYIEETDRLYGRGSTDMKGGNFANALALKAIQFALDQIGVKRLPNTTVVFQSVIEEESGGAGTLAAILRHKQLYPKESSNNCIGIATEPTQLKLFTAQQGSMWFRITITGKQAHGGTRYLGISAIEHAVFVIQTLQRLEAKRNEKLQVPVPINIGKINGGEWPSSVADRVVLEGRIGIIPNPMETIQEAQQALREALENSPEMKQNNVKWKLEFFGARWPPAFCPPEHSFIDYLKNEYINVQKSRGPITENKEDAIPKEPIVTSSPWATDAGYLYHVGNCPSIVFGPGDTALAHQAHETVKVENILRVAEIIARSIIDFSLSDKQN